MKMEQRTFRIGELAQNLEIERFVIRFWEKEFGISSERTDGGQRYYTSIDAQKFVLIKELLYQKGFTIAGAKKHLDQVFGLPRRSFSKKNTDPDKATFVARLLELRHKLSKLRNKLEPLRF